MRDELTQSADGLRSSEERARRRPGAGLLALVSAAACLFLLVSCGGGGSKKPTPTPPPDPAQTLSAAAERLKGVKTFHFKLTHENGTTPMPLSMQLVTAEGDVVVPDRLAADVDAKAIGASVKVKVVGIGDSTWITNPFSRQYEKLPAGISIRDVADPAAFVTTVVQSMQNVRAGGTQSLDGVQTREIDGMVDSGVLQNAVGSAEPGHSVQVQAWIGADDNLPRRIKLTGPVTQGEPQNIVRQLDLSKYDASVDIRPPA